MDFLQSVRKYLKWEMNLIVDENDEPLNQKGLAGLLEIHPRTVQRNMESLVEKKIIYKIEDHKDVFYIVNPYIMYKGSKIHKTLIKLFDEYGYENMNSSEKLKKEK